MINDLNRRTIRIITFVLVSIFVILSVLTISMLLFANNKTAYLYSTNCPFAPIVTPCMVCLATGRIVIGVVLTLIYIVLILSLIVFVILSVYKNGKWRYPIYAVLFADMIINILFNNYIAVGLDMILVASISAFIREIWHTKKLIGHV